ncbi:MAG TPA: hypothetical protein VEI73_17150 [Candidatus Acidoferrum sp.]|nr:hypothetical protein [Candidatus Acidoferrum sp.]
MNAATENPQVENYLAQARAAMRGMPEGDVEDAVRELRSHIADMSEQEGYDIGSALRSLGDPVELAKKYRADNLTMRAECSGSPLVVFQGLRQATRSRSGRFTATALYIFGYINVFTLWSAALEKLFAPSKVGLWYVPGRIFSLTLVNNTIPPDGGRELIGWWLVPGAVLLGWLLHYITNKIAQWWIHRYRASIQSRDPEMGFCIGGS